MYQPLEYGDVLSDIVSRFGIDLTVEDTGGGCLLFQARLETGDWIVISDWDAGITPLPRRRALEAQGTTIGWNISIYADDGDNWPDHHTRLASVRHETAAGGELPTLIAQALDALPANTHHDHSRDGRHTVTHGVITE